MTLKFHIRIMNFCVMKEIGDQFSFNLYHLAKINSNIKPI